ncbi:hypothetical protein Scep_003825 [Stephania cephalantha]|uniref:Uncharacterized protein n=1 Tax=Stephania cephalantha TaxID=152367 RepID=A0AAP0KR95_9MAGN
MVNDPLVAISVKLSEVGDTSLRLSLTIHEANLSNQMLFSALPMPESSNSVGGCMMFSDKSFNVN